MLNNLLSLDLGKTFNIAKLGKPVKKRIKVKKNQIEIHVKIPFNGHMYELC